MTIIEPNKSHFLQSSLLYFAGAMLVLMVAGIYFYNLNVSLKYGISMQEKEIRQLETANADLRNEMYRILDVRNLSAVIQKRNLIQDKNPDYMEYAMLANR
jgi:hypothetical protein